ncbi:MAG: hypothetical protein ACRD8O_22975 [Bryobacteraceae bacterium]
MLTHRLFPLSLLIALGFLPHAHSQTPDLRPILERLEKLERENEALREEIRTLRTEIKAATAAAAPELEERLSIQERRTDEQAQTKVEASQRFPIRITGMAVMNTFLNSKLNGGNDNPAIASLVRGSAAGGASWRQSVIGLEYRGPETFANGKVRGSLFFDFWGGTIQPLNNLPRIRTATIAIDWPSTTFMVGQDKPLISPRDPNSLSQMGVAPLTSAGNLWIWEPQARIEQRFKFGDGSALRLQGALVQTTDNVTTVPAQFAASLERYRPGGEARIEWSHAFGNERRIEIAPGFHASTTHVAATSVPSRLYSLDWLIAPLSRIEFTGMVFTGKNLAHFGIAGIRQGVNVVANGIATPIHSQGGWAQFTVRATDRLSFNFMGGQHDDRNSDLRAGNIGRNQAIGGNFFYRLAPNLLVSFETLQVRTLYLGTGRRLHNHYDLAFAYMF